MSTTTTSPTTTSDKLAQWNKATGCCSLPTYVSDVPIEGSQEASTASLADLMAGNSLLVECHDKCSDKTGAQCKVYLCSDADKWCLAEGTTWAEYGVRTCTYAALKAASEPGPTPE